MSPVRVVRSARMVPRVAAMATHRDARFLLALVATWLTLCALAACEVVDRDAAAKQDSGRARGVVAETAAGTVAPAGAAAVDRGARVASTGDTAVAAGSLGGAGADTGVVELYPARPQRGGVLFVLAPDVTTRSPRCTWKDHPIPCYSTDEGVLVAVPLPADEDAGTFTLTIDRPSGKIVRQITVADHEFGRELIFVPESLYKRATNTREISRDARAIRGIVSVESSERRWTGRWREPLSGVKSAGYGVERYYYRASDSTRSIALDSQARTRGTFAADTTDAALKGAPSWRHAGLDIPARTGAPIRAPAPGVVVDVGNYILSGRTVLIDHGQGAVSAYFHLDTALVSKGDVVRSGERIGRVGATGLATGPHLHYGIYVHGRDVDPAKWRDMPAWFVNAGKGSDGKAGEER